MTLLVMASESARRPAARFRWVERFWVAAGGSRRPPRGAHFEPRRRRRGRLAATEVLLAALVFERRTRRFRLRAIGSSAIGGSKQRGTEPEA